MNIEYHHPQDLSAIFASPPPLPDIRPDIRVGFILSPRFTLLPFAGFIDSLRHASDEADFGRQVYCQWRVVASSLEPVMASCGIKVIPNETFSQKTEFDYIVVVGGRLPECMVHTEEALAYIQKSYQANISIVGLCTGSFVLANAGLLNNRRCAIHVEHRNHLKQLFPLTLPETDKIYINDNEIITCPGGTSALDLAFTLIEQHCGKARAIKGLKSLLVDNHRTSHHMPRHLYNQLGACGNWRVEQAITLMEKHIAKPFRISELANMINTSERELNRTFVQHAKESPMAVWRKIRLDHGHWLLVNTTRTVTTIALECGFSDGAHFCRWFRKIYDETPLEFRRRHRVI
jgi:transcriptional regulator GlxA family with amidase domain